MNNVICPFPFMHLSAATNGNVRLCCNVAEHNSHILDNNGNPTHISDVKNIDELFNLDMFCDIRKKMINGEKIDFCKRCYDVEETGGESVRTTALSNYNIDDYVQKTDRISGKIKDVAIKSLDLSWSNYCNLQCKMCSPSASNQLIDEWKHFGQKYENINLDKWSYEALENLLSSVSPSLHEILVTGGEPLLNKNFLKYIDYLVDNNYAPNIYLVFHTNLTIMPSKFVERFNKFKKTFIHISIDGTGDTYEYIRHPAKWKIVDKNIKQLLNFVKDLDNVQVEVHTVFQSYNLHNIVDLLKYFHQFKDFKNFISFPYFIYPYWPAASDPNIVPLEQRYYYKNQILNYLLTLDINKNTHFYKTLTSCLSMINEKEADISDFIQYNLSRDQFRKQNASEVLPWLKKYV